MQTYDVMVMGGGTSGLCAAWQAGRAGARTALIEKNGLCGGTMTVGGINFPGLFDAWGQQIIAGIGWELVRQTLRETGDSLPAEFLHPESDRQHWRHQIRINPLVFAALADEALLAAGVELRYHTMPATMEATADGWRVLLCGKDGLEEATCRIIVDCTGDANAVRLAGHETATPAVTQPGTLAVQAGGYDIDNLDLARLERNFALAVARGEVAYSDMGWGDRFNPAFLRKHGGNSNHLPGFQAAGSAGKTALEIAGRRSVLRLFRFLKTQPGLENLAIAAAAAECGVRETRTIVGEHMVTAADYLAGRRYDDAICHAFYPIDLHQSAGSGLEQRTLAPGVVPTVPLGALIPRGSRHVLAAGRILASDRLANSALRVQAVCMATGQAAGAAAALASGAGVSPAGVSLSSLRRLLQDHGAIVP